MSSMKVRELYMFKPSLNELLTRNFGVLVAPVQSILLQLALTLTVTICPAAVKEFASKNTLSKEIGIQFTAAPPLDNDQCAPSPQLPVPPIQYKFLPTAGVTDQPALVPEFNALLTEKLAPPVAVMLLILA